MRVERLSLRRQPRPSRKKLADSEEVQRVHELADRLGIVRPRVIWVGETRDAKRQLLEQLRHQQHPSLFEESIG